jgi:hypothetical protein
MTESQEVRIHQMWGTAQDLYSETEDITFALIAKTLEKFFEKEVKNANS